MDETAIAFELPHVRSLASAAAPLDRISVRDYIRRVEIGAFATERGVEQRLRFNVVIEVSHHAAAEADDVDQVISYDSITAAIETELALERINLLETLAERVARRCLQDPRAVRVFVRVEKLDRIRGALGVEIVRGRSAGAHPLRPSAPVEPGPEAGAVVVFLGDGVPAPAWRNAVARLSRPCIVAVGPVEAQGLATGEAMLHAGLLAIDQAAWRAAAADGRFIVASSRTEIAWALQERRPAIWAPTKLVVDAVGRPRADASEPAALALWLAEQIGAERLVVAGGAPALAASAVPVTRLGAGAAAELAAIIEAEEGDDGRNAAGR
jgi:7,8-dihydroneopterin aldolase/epimerase/oxygenase